jgi:tetratricopeptide (TPR) repeat protein
VRLKQPTPGDLVAFVRTSPPARLRIIARRSGAPTDLRDEEVLVRALDQVGVSGSGVDYRAISNRERVINGIPGMQISYRIEAGGKTKYEVVWVGSKAGIVYRLHLTSETLAILSLVAEAGDLFERLSLVDPQRSASPNIPEIRFRSERFGYSVDLDGTGLVAPDPAAWPRRVEFAAVLPAHDLATAMWMVIPVLLDNLRVESDFLDAALCAMVHPDVPDWGAARRSELDGARVRDYESIALLGGRAVSHRVRILERDGFVIAISVYVDGASRERTKVLLETVSRLQLDSSPPASAPSRLTDSERFRQQLFFNALGLAYMRAGRFGEAVPFFERTDVFGSENPVYVRNLAISHLRAGHASDAARVAGEALVRFPMDPELLGSRGLARAELGDLNGAEADLRLARERGIHSDEVLAVHVTVLTALQRHDEALAILDQYIRQTNAPGARLLRSAVLRQAGRRDESIAALREMMRERPNDLAVQGMMVRTAIEDGDPEALLEATEDLIAQDRSGLVLYLRAIALQALGRTAAAIEAIDAASKLAPGDPAIGVLRERLEAARAGGA